MRHVVAPASALPPGSRMRVLVQGRAIAVFNLGGEYFGILDRCPHQGGSLSEGRLVGLVESAMPGDYHYSRPGEILRCPWHGWEFDIRTGQSRCDPGRIRARPVSVTVTPGDRIDPATDVPQGTEVFPVRVHEDYVVIEL